MPELEFISQLSDSEMVIMATDLRLPRLPEEVLQGHIKKLVEICLKKKMKKIQQIEILIIMA